MATVRPVAADVSDVSSVARPSVVQAMALLVGFAVLIAGYLAICSALGNREAYAGFLFLAFWMLIEHGRADRLAHAILGCAFGLGLACLLRLLVTGPLGVSTGGWLFVAALVPVIYLQIRGRLSLLINAPAMATLTALTVPYVQESADFLNAAIALVISWAYFGAIIVVARRVVSLQSSTPSTTGTEARR